MDTGLRSFRDALEKGYEPDGQRWGIKALWRDAKVRMRIRDDHNGGMWVRFVVYSNSIGVEPEKRKAILEAMIEVVEALEGEFPIVGER